MRTVCCVLAILFYSIPLFAQTKAQVQGKTEFKPGDTVTMTVTFAKKLPHGSTVTLNYTSQKKPVECGRDLDLPLGGGKSNDDQTFQFSTTVTERASSGIYVFGAMQVSSPGLLSSEVTKDMDAPTITVKNKPCPNSVEIPSFQITLNP